MFHHKGGYFLRLRYSATVFSLVGNKAKIMSRSDLLDVSDKGHWGWEGQCWHHLLGKWSTFDEQTNYFRLLQQHIILYHNSDEFLFHYSIPLPYLHMLSIHLINFPLFSFYFSCILYVFFSFKVCIDSSKAVWKTKELFSLLRVLSKKVT